MPTSAIGVGQNCCQQPHRRQLQQRNPTAAGGRLATCRRARDAAF